MLQRYASGTSLRQSQCVHGGLFIFFFTEPASTEIYTLSLHDALPIYSLSGWPARAFDQPPEYHAQPTPLALDRKSTRLNSSHVAISYAVFCLKKKIHSKHKRLAHRLNYLAAPRHCVFLDG